MPTTYNPKHKRPTPYAGGTPRGPERWARAAHNAILHPNSEAARLYQKRVRLAVEYRDLMENIGAPETVLSFMQWSPRGTVAKRDYSVCSHYCAAMQAQLDRRATSLANIIRALSEDARDIEHEPTLVRDVRCQCCGSTIKKRG